MVHKSDDLKSNAYWKDKLSKDEYRVTREKGTEPPFTGKYYGSEEPGTYSCVCCGQELFRSETKYDSGSGWPSFWKPVNSENVLLKSDSSHGMTRIEASCSNCNAHLGHQFDDGPQPTRKRYCINSCSLKLTK